MTDVAIGAPQEGDDGSGAVYIYHGSNRGIETQYRQVCLKKCILNWKHWDNQKWFAAIIIYCKDLPNQKLPKAVIRNESRTDAKIVICI